MLPRRLQTPLRRTLWSLLAPKQCELFSVDSRREGCLVLKQSECPWTHRLLLQSHLGRDLGHVSGVEQCCCRPEPSRGLELWSVSGCAHNWSSTPPAPVRPCE